MIPFEVCEEWEQTKSKVIERSDIIKIRDEIMAIKSKRIWQTKT